MKAVFTGSMKFRNDTAEQNFMQWVQARHKAIRTQQGVDGRGVFSGWMKKRVDFESEYFNDFAHRSNDPRYGKLYALFGTSDNLPKRAINVFWARTCDNLLGGANYASFVPEGPEDATNPIPAVPGMPSPIDPIKEADRYWQRKLTDGDVKPNLRMGVLKAGYVGECVLKIGKGMVESVSERTKARQWLDQPDGAPMTDITGRYIYEDDEWEPSSDVVGAEALKRDPNTLKPNTAVLAQTKEFVKDRPPQRQLRISALNFRDFVASPTEKDIHTADYVADEFDYDLDKLINATDGLRLSKEAKGWLDIKKVRGTRDAENLSEGGQPRTIHGEQEISTVDTLGKLQLAESWLRYDVAGRGRTEEVYVLWEVSTGHPVYYDFLEEVSDTGRRPYEVVRAIPTPDRWWGMSFYEMLSNEHNFVDLQKTRLNYRNSQQSSIKLLRENSIAEVEAGWKFDITLNHVWNVKQSDVANNNRPPLEIIELQKFDEGIWEMLADARKTAQVMSGSLTAADIANADLNESKTLGQTQLLNNESEMMANNQAQDVMVGIVGALKQSIVCLFSDATQPAFVDQFNAELNDVLGSVRGQEVMRWLQMSTPKKLLNYVRLLMSKQRNKEQMQANLQAKQLMVGEMTWLEIEALGPQVADRLRSLFLGIFNNLDVQAADKLLATPMLPVAPVAAPGAPGGPGGTQTASGPSAVAAPKANPQPTATA